MKNAYQQIADELEKAIGAGQFSPREKLPSVRELCAAYQVSKSTAVKAYDLLKSKHLVYSVPQSGCYVVAHRLKIPVAETKIINFSRGNPLLENIYTPDLKHCLDQAIDICNNNSAEWHEIYGVPSLRKLLPKYLVDFQVFTTPDNIFVNLGVQQVLTILSKMPFPNQKEIILIEQPTFRYYSKFLKSIGANVLGIPRGQEGIDVEVLEELFKTQKIKFFYTIPRAHNPLGTSYSKEQCKTIAHLAKKYDVYIVEDDYFGDILCGNHSNPIYSYGDHQHHIYLRSFIKIIPWIRIGITVIPNCLLDNFTELAKEAYFNSYFSPSLVSQATLEVYIRSKLLRKHATSIKKELAVRLARVRRHFAEAENYGAKWVGGESGFYCYLKLPDDVDEKTFVENLEKRGIVVTPGRECFLDKRDYEKGIRLSVARTRVEDIERGMLGIYQELKNSSAKKE